MGFYYNIIMIWCFYDNFLLMKCFGNIVFVLFQNIFYFVRHVLMILIFFFQAKSRMKLNFLDQLAKFWELQVIILSGCDII